jgi:uncharacterized membrane-anchored protein
MSKKIALASLIVVLALVNWSIFAREKQLAEGGTIYLELAPVDPRSLMQGDYMALRFRLPGQVSRALSRRENSEDRRRDETASDGYVVVRLDERNIASFAGLYENQILSEEEVVVRYRVRNGEVRIATDAFFFQEGHGEYYESARYGQFRINDKGELLLTAMYDENLNKLGPSEKE